MIAAEIMLMAFAAGAIAGGFAVWWMLRNVAQAMYVKGFHSGAHNMNQRWLGRKSLEKIEDDMVRISGLSRDYFRVIR